MSDSEKKYPSQVLLEKYLAVRDVPKYYSISEELVMELVNCGKVHYAELKDPMTNRRIPHVNMEDVLRALGRRVRLFHLENKVREDLHE